MRTAGLSTTAAAPTPFPPTPSIVDPAIVASYPDGASHMTDQEISLFADMRPTPVSLRTILETTDLREAARFLHSEYPVRCAERIRMIESIPTSGWVGVPELVEAHGRHVLAFWRMRAVALGEAGSSLGGSGSGGGDGLEEFTDACMEIVHENTDMTSLITKGVTDLHRRCDDGSIDEAFVDTFLNNFLLKRLGSSVLLKQYLALSATRSSPGPGPGPASAPALTGIVDPNTDVAGLCRETARTVRKMCRERAGTTPPPITVEAYSADADDYFFGVGRGRSRPTFSFIPPALNYILRELLKNSCRATVDACASLPAGEVRKRPVSVIVSADERRMMICVSDRGGGIPFDVVPNVWSYLHSTTRMKPFGAEEEEGGLDQRQEQEQEHRHRHQHQHHQHQHQHQHHQHHQQQHHHHQQQHQQHHQQQQGDGTSLPSELAGYGIGLPMSRLYARYLGGDLKIVSMPGYGTHAYVFLPRMSSDQVEHFPENDELEFIGGRGEYVL